MAASLSTRPAHSLHLILATAFSLMFIIILNFLGKHSVSFMTKSEVEALYEKPNAERIPAQALLPDGGIDWDCPCLQGMAQGPCGQEFKDAFSCFVKSTAEPRASDCVPSFEKMQACLERNAAFYGPKPGAETASAAEAPAPTSS